MTTNFETVAPHQIVGEKIAFVYNGEPRAEEVESLKYRINPTTLLMMVRVRTPKGKYFWVHVGTPLIIVKKSDS